MLGGALVLYGANKVQKLSYNTERLRKKSRKGGVTKMREGKKRGGLERERGDKKEKWRGEGEGG